MYARIHGAQHGNIVSVECLVFVRISPPGLYVVKMINLHTVTAGCTY